MKTIKISNLQEGDLFIYKDVMYEIVHKDKWETYCKYVNDKHQLGWFSSEYLYCKFSNYTKVEDWVNMKTIKISNLQEGDLFIYKDVMYEIVHKDKWETYCKYVNDKHQLGWFSSEYLYCKFSNYTKVEV